MSEAPGLIELDSGVSHQQARVVEHLARERQDIVDASPMVEARVSALRKADILVVDINGFGYASMYVPALTRLSHAGRATGGIHGALTSLLSAMTRQPGAVPFVLWDRPASWRSEALPEYKSNRNDTPEKVAIKVSYKEQVPVIQMMLTALGLPQVSCGEAEADDLAGAICRNIDPTWCIEMITRDTDWYQGLDQHVSMYSPLSRSRVDLAILADPDNDLSDGHFLNTWEYLQAKALSGDSSDVISGIQGIGLKTAVKHMRAHGGTIQSFWAAVDAGRVIPNGVIQKRLAETASRAIYERNIRLMDWRLAPAMRTDTLSLTAGPVDWVLAQDIAEEFGLSKMLAQARLVMTPWQERGWGNAIQAVDAALHPTRCLPVPRRCAA